MKSVGVVTTSRADYGIYRSVLSMLEDAEDFDVRLFVSGMHLAPQFGLTVREIESDGFCIQERVDTLLSGDTPAAIAKSMGIATTGFASAFQRWQPDFVMVLGDRYEMQPAALAALPFRIPVAHLHGGELTLGAIDDALRHCLTKLSHLHFAATEEYSRRIRQLGEEPWRITVSGAPSLDSIQGFKPLSDEEFTAQFGVTLPEEFLLVTFHPTTLEHECTEDQLDHLFEALDTVGLPVLFTLANADTGGQLINKRIGEYALQRDTVDSVGHLGTNGYFTAMSRARAMVGNSSSGLLEAPSFRLPVVNIGRRQQGRVRGLNVIDVNPRATDIAAGIINAVSDEFHHRLEEASNPYGDGHAADRILETLRAAPDRRRLINKGFVDVE